LFYALRHILNPTSFNVCSFSRASDSYNNGSMDHGAILTRSITNRSGTASHHITMPFSTGTTAVERVDQENESSKLPRNDLRPPQRVNADSTLPTHVLPPRNHTEPPAFGIHPSHNQTTVLSTNNSVTTHDQTNTWFSHVKEYAPVVGVVGTIIGVVVAIVTVAVK